MEFLNIGVLELIFILLIAFIILGPKRAVETAGQIGRWIRKLISSPFWHDIVSTTRDIKDLPRKIMDDAELQKTIAEIERSTQEVNASFNRSPGIETLRQSGTEIDDAEESHLIYPEIDRDLN